MSLKAYAKAIYGVFKFDGFEEGIGAIGDVSKNVLKDLKSFASSTAGMFTIGTVAAIGMFKAIEALSDAYNLSYDSAMKNTNAHLDNYNTTKNEIEQLTSQAEEYKNILSSMGEKYEVDLSGIEDVSDMVSALKQSGKIELFDEVEIQKIENANSSLERQLDIKQKLADSEQKLAASDARDALGRGEQSVAQQVAQDVPGGKRTYQGWVGNVNTVGAIEENVAAIQKYESEIEELEKTQASYDPGDIEWENAQKDIDSYNEALEKLHADLDAKATDLSTLLSAFSVDGEGLFALSDYEEEFKSVKRALSSITEMDMSPMEKQLSRLDSFFDGSFGKNAIKDQLLDAVSAGEKASDALKSLGLTLDDLGVSDEDAFNRYFDGLIESAKEAEKAINSVDGSVEGVTAAFESANKDADWNSMADYLSKAQELYESGKVGTDDFKTAAQFMAPDIINPDAEGFEFDADAYVAAWEDARGKIKRYFDSENEFQSITNFANDLVTNELATKVSKGDGKYTYKWTDSFKTTAQAADELGLSLEATETLMHNLESYGFEFESIMWSGEGLDRYKSSLEGIKDIYDSMESGAEKNHLGSLIENWDSELAGFEDDLSTLTEDQIIKIEFEYDLATIRQELQELEDAINSSGGTTEEWAAYNSKQAQEQALLSSQEGMESALSDKGFTAQTQKYNELSQKLKSEYKELGEDGRRELQMQQAAILNLQNAYLEAFQSGEVVDWNEFLGSTQLNDTLEQISNMTTLSVDQLRQMFNIPTHTTIGAETMVTPEVVQSQLADSVEGSTITFSANLDGVERQIEAIKNEDGTISYSANIDGTTVPVSVTEKNGMITFSADTTKVDEEVEKTDGGTRTTVMDVDSSKVDAETAKTNGGTRTTTYRADISSLPTTFSPITRFVNYVVGMNQVGSGLGKIGDVFGKSSGTVLSPAHSSGTAYNVLNTIPISSYANGKVSLDRNEKALVNEVGTESLIRDGVWSLLPGGMHIANLKKGDIILNAEQTADLLNHGKTNGHARAYASGTLMNSYSGGRLPTSIPYNPISSTPSYSSTTQAAEATKEATEETKTFMEQMEEFFSKFKDWIKVNLDHLNRMFDKAVDKFSSEFKFDADGSAFSEAISMLNQTISETQQGRDKYWLHAQRIAQETGLPADLQTKIHYGAIDITEYDEETKKKIELYSEWYDKVKECEDALDDLRKQQSELAQENFDKLVSNYDSQLDQIAHRQKLIDDAIKLTEEKGHLVGTTYYKALMGMEAQNINKLQEEYDSLKESFDYAVNEGNIEKYSEAWYEMLADIQDVSEALSEATLNMQEFENSIRDLQWDNFDYLFETIDHTVDEINFVTELLKRNNLFDDKGLFNKEGLAVLGQHAVKYNIEMGKSDEYADEIEELEKSLEIDPFNKDTIARREELLDLQREAIQNAEDEKEAMIQLVREGVELQIEAMQELIDKKKEALDREKELHDYQKDIAEKTERVTSLEKQLGAVQGDDSEENMQRIQTIKNELNEARKDLEETEYDKYISDHKDILDELFQNFSDTLNSQFDNLAYLTETLIGVVNENSYSIADTITTATENVGYTISSELQNIWNSGSGISSVVSMYASDFNAHATTVQEYLKSINIFMQEMKAKAEAEAAATVAKQQAQSQAATQTTKPVTTKPPTTTTPKASSSSGGDGVPRVGDAVTFASGQYFYSSDGLSPTGNQMLGQTVYISKINNASWAKKPYHITRDKAGTQWLGWVSLDQLKGYRKGTDRVTHKQLAWLMEGANGKSQQELLFREDGGMLTLLNPNDAIANAGATKTIVDFGNKPTETLQKYLPSYMKREHSIGYDRNVGGSNVSVAIDGDIVLPSVTKPEEFSSNLLKTLKEDTTVRKALRSVTTDTLSGRSEMFVRRF